MEKNERKELDHIFFDRVDIITQAINRRCFLGINDSEFHFALYEKGSYYKKHRDAFENDDSRKISVVLYLNKNWKEEDGGELMIYSEENLKVEPRAGTLVIFESHLEHEVLESRKDRISITGWLKNVRKIL